MSLIPRSAGRFKAVVLRMVSHLGLCIQWVRHVNETVTAGKALVYYGISSISRLVTI